MCLILFLEILSRPSRLLLVSEVPGDLLQCQLQLAASRTSPGHLPTLSCYPLCTPLKPQNTNTVTAEGKQRIQKKLILKTSKSVLENFSVKRYHINKVL